MYMRIAALVPVAALAAVAAAAPSGLEARSSSTSSCDTGSIQCCTQTSDSNSSLTSILGLLGIVIPDVTGILAIGCTGTTVCAQQPVCCSGNTFNGLVNIGCSPIIINV